MPESATWHCGPPHRVKRCNREGGVAIDRNFLRHPVALLNGGRWFAVDDRHGTTMAPRQKRAWQRMLSGRRLDLLDPTPVDIEIEDIAHGLAFVARWNGQTIGDYPYSVAEHSLLVEAIFSRLNPGIAARWQMAALLHDAPEYVIGDMISPVKVAIGPGYGALDERLTAAIHLRFGLPAQLPAAIKKAIKAADTISAWLEATQIAGFTRDEADRFFGGPPGFDLGGLPIRLRAPIEVRADFVARHRLLLGEVRH